MYQLVLIDAPSHSTLRPLVFLDPRTECSYGFPDLFRVTNINDFQRPRTCVPGSDDRCSWDFNQILCYL